MGGVVGEVVVVELVLGGKLGVETKKPPGGGFGLSCPVTGNYEDCLLMNILNMEVKYNSFL